MAAEDDFRKSFAEALAFELQKNEDRKPTSEELLEETYVQLCHDDPQNWTAQGCDLLSKAVLDDEHPYALSERLIEGIQQVVQRHNETKEEGEEATAACAVARLAWTVHIRIPMACLAQKGEDVSKISSLLGSYRGSEAVKTPSAAAVDSMHPLLGGETLEKYNTDESIEAKKEASEPSVNVPVEELQQPLSIAAEDHDSLEEVWAAESDPSDYAYESEDQPTTMPQVDEWASSLLDPIKLSRPCNSNNKEEMAKAVASLLQTAHYSPHFSRLSVKDWKDGWPEWKQWILALLLAQPGSLLMQIVPNDDNSTVQDASVYWQHIGLHLLHIVRDAAMDQSALLSDYIQLIQTLLQVQAAREDDGSNTDDDKGVAPAAWVGLGALAAVCQHFDSCSVPATLQLLQNSILESCDDLTLLLERSMAEETGDRQAHLTLQWTYASLLQMLLGPHDDDLPNAHGQTLLQSGLFRQYLLHWSSNPGDSCPPVLLDLCARSPILLGKYAWRFPGLAASLCKDASSINGLLWNLMGIQLAAAPSASRLRLRGAAAESSPPSAAECKTAAWSSFQELCQKVQSSLEEYRKSPTKQIEKFSALTDFSALVERLARLPLLTRIFVTEMAPNADGKSPPAVVQAALRPLREALTREAVVIVETVSEPEVEPADVDDDDDNKKSSPPKKSRPSVAVQELRRHIKTLSTLLLDDYGGDGSCTGSRPQRAASSKAD